MWCYWFYQYGLQWEGERTAYSVAPDLTHDYNRREQEKTGKERKWYAKKRRKKKVQR